MKLVNALIIEEDGKISVIPQGTTIIENVVHLYDYIIKEFIKNINVRESSVKENSDTVLGTQRDVDEFDEHKVLTLSGTVIYDTAILLDDEQRKKYSDGPNRPWSLENFKKDLQEDMDGDGDLHDYYIVDRFSDNGWFVGSDGLNDNLDISRDTDRSEILDIEMDGNLIKLVVKSSFSRMYMLTEEDGY